MTSDIGVGLEDDAPCDDTAEEMFGRYAYPEGSGAIFRFVNLAEELGGVVVLRSNHLLIVLARGHVPNFSDVTLSRLRVKAS